VGAVKNLCPLDLVCTVALFNDENRSIAQVRLGKRGIWQGMSAPGRARVGDG